MLSMEYIPTSFPFVVPPVKEKQYYMMLGIDEDEFNKNIDFMSSFVYKRIRGLSNIIICCIGTDRATGDCYGPMVGTYLEEGKCPCPVIGTLDSTLHAKNLINVYKNIKEDYPGYFIIAVDASLGNINRIGSISIRDGAASPGSGLEKNLPEIGDMSFSGQVNISTDDAESAYIVIQNTSLGLVRKLALGTSKALLKALRENQLYINRIK